MHEKDSDSIANNTYRGAIVSRCENPNRTDSVYPKPPELLQYLQICKKKATFQRLQTIWKEIRNNKRKIYCTLQDKEWKVQVRAIYKNGIRIYYNSSE